MAENDGQIGANQLGGMHRIGYKELAQALPAFPNQSVQPVEELGMAGNPTPADLAVERKSFKETLQEYTPGYSGRESDRDLER